MKETKMTDEFENPPQFNQGDDGLEHLFNNLPGNQSPPADAPGTDEDHSSPGAQASFDAMSAQPGRSPHLYAFGALTGRSRLEAAAHTANPDSPPPTTSPGFQR